MPPYLVAAPQEGLAAHVRAVCAATGLGVILYSRGNAVFEPDTIRRLAEDCPNLIALKDGAGRLDAVRAVSATLGDRLVCIGGMPTHEVHAEAHRAAGCATYSSAIYNFAPALALRFHAAVEAGDRGTLDALLTRFFLPFARLRAQRPGYAVALVKAGVRLAGHDCGGVRPPLTDPGAADCAALAALIDAASEI
jgi:5-dehydro-4-deoxyglucarate dehydratase